MRRDAPPLLRFEELEPRILYSADAALLLGAVGLDAPAEQRVLPAAVVAATPRELVFVDARVPDAMGLVDRLARTRGEGRSLEVVMLDAGRDGLAQIGDVLAGEHGLAAVHLISHGADGQVQLGASVLDAEALAQRATEIAAWGSALAADGDLLIYGCDVAAAPEGQAMVDALAKLTGADVAASRDATGSTAAGGNWALEYTHGAVQAALAVPADLQQAWAGTLAVTQGNVSSAATSTAGANSLSFAHTVGSGVNGMLIVEVAQRGNQASSSVTYGGVALTLLGSASDAGNVVRTELWYLKAPVSGSANVVVTLPTNHEFVAGATSFFNVDQTASFGAVATASGSGATASVSVASASGERVVDVAVARGNSSATVGAGQSTRWTQRNSTGSADAWGGASSEAGAPTVTMSWTITPSEWAAIGVSLKPAAAIAPVNSVPGAQTTSVDTPRVFSQAQGNAISVTDADAAGGTNEVTLSVAHGTLTLAGTTGLSFITGDGTADATMTLRGSAAAINTALDGLVYRPASGYVGGDTLSVNTRDSLLLGLDVDSGLLGRYAFDNPALLGTDSSPAAGYNGSVTGATAVNDATRGPVLALAGAGYVQANGHFGNPSSVTLAAWVKLTSPDSTGAEVISLGDSVILRVDEAGYLNSFIYDGAAFVQAGHAVTLAGAGWHHVATTFDDANDALTLYLDGTAVASVSTTSSISYILGANSFIGKHGNGRTDFDFNGQIDDARVYNRALSASDIAALAADTTLVANSSVALTVSSNTAPSFGRNGDGTLLTPLGSGSSDAAITTAVQADGKIVVAGWTNAGGSYDFALLRYNADGSLDKSFGNGGRVLTDFGGDVDYSQGIAVQADGKIVLAGAARIGGIDRVAVARYNNDGSLDATFGSGGKVTTAVGASAIGYATVLQADGRIVVGGATGTDVLVLRYTTGGVLDASFDGDGIFTYNAGGTEYVTALTVQADGKIVSAGGGPGGGFVGRQNTNGSLDASFGGIGYVYNNFATTTVYNSVVVQADGRIAAAGYTQGGASKDVVVARYTAAGALDTSFNGTGYNVGALTAGDDVAYKLALQADGKLLFAGTTAAAGGAFTVARLTAAGAYDTTFNGNGRVATNFSGASAAFGLALQADGKAVAVGSVGGSGLPMARYTTNGALDASFGTYGLLDATPAYTEDGAAVVLDADVQLLDAELEALNGGNGNFAGASLDFARQGGANAQDVFAFTDGNGITRSGASLLKAGAVIASFDTSTPGQLNIVFTDANGQVPTSADVNAIARQITYANTSDAPPASVRIDSTLSDGNSGAQGSGAALTGSGSITVALTASNDAPTLTNAALTGLGGSYSEDAPSSAFLVQGIVNATGFADPDASTQAGMALTGVGGRGRWQFSTDNLAWTDVGAVSGSSALLLAPGSWLRYVPDNANGENPQISFRAWDGSSGSASANGTPSLANPGAGGGSSAFSSATAFGRASIFSVNDAPVLDATKSPVLAAVNEDAGAPVGAVGTLVTALVDFDLPAGQVDNVSDVDAFAQLGIAVTAADTANGSWYFSTDNGTNWNALGSVSDSGARLLAADGSTRLYFRGNANFNGSLAGAITFRAWDRSSGSNGSVADVSVHGGTSAFSTDTDTASLLVNAVNDAPVITSNGGGATAAASAQEWQTAVTTVSATDVEGDPIGFSIAGGADAAKFVIDGSTGVLRFATAPEFDNPLDANGDNVYEVTVQAFDGAAATTQALSITVTDVVNELAVSTATDTLDGDTSSIGALLLTPGADGLISLREAILAANNNLNAGSAPDLIRFAIAGTGVHTISLGSLLPTITGAVTIDASTDDSYVANGSRPAVVLDGNDLAGDGLRLGAGSSGSTLRGLVIRNFAGTGISILNGSNNVTLVGNYVGALDASGAYAGAGSGNGSYGIDVGPGALNITIGGAGAGQGNVVSGNGNAGVLFEVGSTGSILGNRIGTDASGNNPIAGVGAAVFIASSGIRIGGSAAGEGNVIAGSNTAGIIVSGAASTGNAILGNRVFGNAGLGIDLSATFVADGVNANDTLDGDSGPNNLQNFPVMTGARSDGAGQVQVTGRVNSTANTALRLEFFASSASHGSGHGPAERYLGFVDVDTDASGNAVFDSTLAASVAVGEFVSATATRSDVTHTVFSDSSEFARNAVAVSSLQARIVVDTTSDAADGDTTSLSTLLADRGADGRISLREALLAANGSVNGSSGADRIDFSIAAALVGGAHTINIAAALPSIGDAVFIDGSSEPDWASASAPVVMIDGGNSVQDGLVLAAGSGGSTLRGLAIGGFTRFGIGIGSSGNSVVGNFIGTSASGLAARGNGVGIHIAGGAANVIGGPLAADRNVIAGNAGDAVWIEGEAADGNTVQGNWIGVNATSSAMLANAGDGIHVTAGADGAVIGGASAGEGNWIAGGTNGINILGVSSGVVIRGNRIGTDATGTANWGTQENGIWLSGGVNGAQIGGVLAGQGNLIAYAGQGGVWTAGIDIDGATSTDNAILGNRIYGSVGIAIDLNGDGPSANDVGDADSGGNRLQNFPVLTSVRFAGGRLLLSGHIDSTPNTHYRIELFADNAPGTQARTYLGSVDVQTDGSGVALFGINWGGSATPGQTVSATATVTNAAHTVFGDTSELSAAVPVTQAPLITPGEAALIYDARFASIFVDPALAVSDADSLQLAGATVRIAANFITGIDVLGFLDQNGITGSWNAGAGVLTLTGAATLAQYQTALRSVSYANTSANPGGAARRIEFAVDDGYGSSAVVARDVVIAVNDGPMNTLPVAPTAAEDVSTPIDGIVITDADAGTNELTAVLSVALGRLDASASAGVSVSGSGTGTLVLKGQLADLNAWFASADRPRYTGPADFNGSVALQMVSSDGRNLGAGGTLLAGSFDYRFQDATPAGFDPDNIASTGGITGSVSDLNVTALATALSGSADSFGVIYSGAFEVTTAGSYTFDVGADDAAKLRIDGQLVVNNWHQASATGSITLAAGRHHIELRYFEDVGGQGLSVTVAGPDTGAVATSLLAVPNVGRLVSATAISTINVTPVNDAPLLSDLQGSLTLAENAGPQRLAPAATVSDIDSPDFDGATLTTTITANALPEDRLTVLNQGNAPGQVGVSGNSISVGGVLVASFNGPAIGGSALVITFNANATAAEVQAVARQVAYENTSEAPSAAPRTIEGVLSDGDGGSSAVTTMTVATTPVNDAPQIQLPAAGITNEDTALRFGSATGNAITVSDVDAGSGLLQVSLTAVHGRITLAGVAGLTFTVGSGVAYPLMSFNGTLADIHAALDGLSFQPDANYHGLAGIQITVNDLGGSGSGGALTLNATQLITVLPVNDAPVIQSGSTLTLPGTDEDTPGAAVSVASLLADARLGYADADGATPQGLAITGSSGRGRWQYSTDAVGWQDIGEVDAGQALLLDASAWLRYLPDGRNGEVVALTVRGWDGSSGSASTAGTPAYAAPGAGGGSSAFSNGAASLVLAVAPVNDTPVALVLTDPAAGNLAGPGPSQTIATTAGQAYLLSFDFANTTGTPSASLDVYWRGSKLASIEQDGSVGQTWRFVVSGSGGSDALSFVETNASPVGLPALLGNVSLIAANTGTQAIGLDENSANGSVVASAAAADLDFGDSASFSLVDSAAGRFAIDAASGLLTVADASRLDFETNAQHQVTVRVTDAAGATLDRVFTIALRDMNEAVDARPDVALALEAGGIGNALPGIDPVGNVLANDSDPDAGDSRRVIGVAAAGGTPSGAAIGATLQGRYGSLLLAADGSYVYTVDNGNADVQALRDAGSTLSEVFTYSVADAAGLVSSADLSITITGFNDTPVLLRNAGLTVAENATGTVIGPALLAASDVDDNAAALRYTLTSGPANGQLLLAGVALRAGDGFTQADVDAGRLRYDHDGSETSADGFDFSLDDGTSAAQTGRFAIAITPVNDHAPVITGPAEGSVVTVAENTLAVTAFDASDADLPTQTLGFAIAGGADAAHFSIDAATGVVGFLAAPDFEAPADADANGDYELVISASDGSLVSLRAITVRVGNVNETPSVGVPAAQTVAEDGQLRFGSAWGNALTLADADAGDAPLQLTLAATHGRLTLGSSAGLTVLAGADGSAGLTLQGRLADLQAALDGLAFAPAADFLGSAELTIGLDDGGASGSGGPLAAAARVAIDVLPVNDAPQLVASAGLTVAENELGRVIGPALLRAVDIDNTAVELLYTLSAAPAHGSLRLAGSLLANGDHFTQADIDAGRLSYDHDGSETTTGGFAFTLDDGAGGTAAGTFAIAITPVNDHAPQFESSPGMSLNENVLAVGTVAATDGDLPAAGLQFRIVGGADAARFTLDASTGELRFAAAPDSEAPADAAGSNPYRLIVEVSDGELSSTQQIEVQVRDVNEAPQGADTARSTLEDTALILGAADFGIADVDAGDRLGSATIERITGSGRFVLAGAAGDLAIAAGQTLTAAELARLVYRPATDASGPASATLQVRVADAGGLLATSTSTLTIDVQPVNDAPQLLMARFSLQAGQPMTPGATALAASDIDNASDTLRFIVTDLRGGRFEQAAQPGVAIEDFTQAELLAGQVRFIAFAADPAPSFRIAVSDGALRSAPVQATVEVQPALSVPGLGEPAPPPAPAAAPEEAAGSATARVPAAARAAAGTGAASGEGRPREAAARSGNAMVAEVTMLGAATEAAEPAANTRASANAPAGSTAKPLRSAAVSPTTATVPDLDVELTREAEGGRSLIAAEETSATQRRGEARGSATEAEAAASETREGGQQLGVATQAVRAAGAALTAGTVWWALRAGGLAASLLVVLPAWRHVDLLAVLPDDEDDDPWDDSGPAPDDEAARDERAVRRVFDAAREGEKA